MYQKYAAILLTFSGLLICAWCSVRGVQIDLCMAREAFWNEPLEVAEQLLDFEKNDYRKEQKEAELGRPVISCRVLEQEQKYYLSLEDYEILLQIVEAEAGTEDEEGRLLVANVILNRVISDRFPDTVKEVVYQCENGVSQFSPVRNGKIYKVKISEATRRAVERALYGEDISRGALYFAARKAADPENMDWFDSNLTRLFAHGGHEFFE